MTNIPPDLKNLRIWRCRLWVKELGRRNRKISKHHCKGQFLEHYNTLVNIIYFNKETKTIKTSTHHNFDELFTKLKNPPSNAQVLRSQFFILLTPTILQPDHINVNVLQQPFTCPKDYELE